jgi:hypothetical protein
MMYLGGILLKPKEPQYVRKATRDRLRPTAIGVSASKPPKTFFGDRLPPIIYIIRKLRTDSLKKDCLKWLTI